MTRSRYYEENRNLIVFGAIWFIIGLCILCLPGPFFTHYLGLLIMAFWGMLAGLMYATTQELPTVPPFESITDEQEFYALEHFGYFVDELQEQYEERKRLLVASKATLWTSRSRRYPVLREMVKISESRLRDIQENTCSSQS